MRWNTGELLLPNGATLRVTGGGFVSGALELSGGAEMRVTHALETRHVWVPHLTPEEGNVIGDWVFRSPAIVLADREIALALIVDVDDVRRGSGFRAWLDYDHPRKTVTLAAGAYRQDGHVFFVREPAPVPKEIALRLHVVASTRAEDVENPYGLAARFCWERWGRAGFESAAHVPFATHMDRIATWAFSSGWSESVWQRVDGSAEGGTSQAAIDEQRAAPVFIVDVHRHPSVPPEERTWREPRSIWNQAWFSTQRCANGLLRYARQIGSADLERRAREMTEVALSAPQTDGLFPSRLVSEDFGAKRRSLRIRGARGAEPLEQEDGSWHWSNSDRRPASASEHACHLVDAAFTCRKLVEWHALTGDARALAYAERFADRAVALRRPSGAFPGWVEPDGAVPEELSEGPESAVTVSLLFDIGRADEARRSLSFLEEIARDGRWEDFETYYSCSRWGTPGERVARNGVYKQNTLSIAWCAEAFLLAWRAGREEKWLRLARRCVDELSLYQAVWSPPFLPAPAHGGFGVMNADAEWSDARQSLFAPLYFDLARETGDRELVERGSSALRASFAMLYCPENADLARAYERRFPFFGPESWGFMMENQGHDVAQPIGTFTIFTWGNGSALEAVATVRDRFPEIDLR